MANSMAESKRTKFDDVFQHLNSLGCYQHFVYWAYSCLKIPMVFQFSSLIFAYGTQKFECVSPNVTCPINKCCQNCTSYAFDKTFVSAVSQWGLICDKAYITAIMQSAFFWGMLVGSFTGGWSSDKFGRKKWTFGNCFLLACFSLISAFVDSPIAVSILRFCIGFSQISIMLSSYALSIELVGPTKRTFAGVATTFLWKIGGALSVLFAYAFPYWRYFVIAGSVPGFLFLPFYKILPESPRWLVAQGRLDEALDILVKFGAKNKKPVDTQLLRKLLEEVREDQLAQHRVGNTYHFTDLCKTPRVRRFSLIVCFNWFVVALVFFAMFLFVTRLYGNIFINAAIMNVTDIPFMCLTWICAAKFGRRLTSAAIMFVSAVVITVLPFIQKDFQMVKTTLAIAGKSLLGAQFTLVYMMTSELFPTVIRSISIGTGSTMARFGAILAPFLLMMAQLPGLSLKIPFCIFGGLAILSSILTLLLPETLFANMEQTINAAEEAQLDYSIPCCGNKPTKHEVKMSEETKKQDEDVKTTLI